MWDSIAELVLKEKPIEKEIEVHLDLEEGHFLC